MLKEFFLVLFFLDDKSVINISFPQTRGGVELCLRPVVQNSP